MARNRKRAKDRRPRPPAGGPVAAAARLDLDGAPDPIEHATPDAELAEAQLALGRPELIGDQPVESDEELAAEALEADSGPAGRAREDGAVTESRVEAGRSLPAARQRPGPRLVTFLQGSWRELQRVQWPDRRQVMQATGVVIGFVIVAGVYLGAADSLAGKLVTFILK